MLAFSKYPIGAATVIDGNDGGYWEYLAQNQSAELLAIYEGQHGASPFGGGLRNWLKTAPSFNLDRIHTPSGS